MKWPWKREAKHRQPILAPVTVVPIGYVRNDVGKPRPHGWERVESEIVVLAEHAGKLVGIEAYSHVVVVFWMDLAPGAPEQPETLTLASGNAYGIFATRSQLRPNHLGVSAVALLARDGATLRVRGLDAIDGTPVLDIKPYLPEYDAVSGASIPDG
ncbi:MAG: SAM-dependent methyltransferase [Dehalococcoidia bacterium]